MSLNTELSRKAIQFWRDAAGSPFFMEGLTHLRHNHAPVLSGTTEADLLKSALGWKAYMQALADIEDVLTALPKNNESLDEPSLNDR